MNAPEYPRLRYHQKLLSRQLPPKLGFESENIIKKEHMKTKKQIVINVLVRLAVVIIGVVVLAGQASAQVSTGLNEVGGLGKFDSNGEQDSWAVDIDAFYGRFVTDRWQIGPKWNIYKVKGSKADGAWSGFASVHLGNISKPLVPYVQGSLGRSYGRADGNQSFLTAGPGIKWFVAGGHGALNVNAFYRRTFADNGLSARDGFALNVGASLFFK